MNKFSSQVLRFNVKTCIAHSGTRLSIKFQSNYQTKNDHQHDTVFYAKSPGQQSTEDYTRETRRHLIERMKDHSGRRFKVRFM